jgi:hypothetical protein
MPDLVVVLAMGSGAMNGKESHVSAFSVIVKIDQKAAPIVGGDRDEPTANAVVS